MKLSNAFLFILTSSILYTCHTNTLQEKNNFSKDAVAVQSNTAFFKQVQKTVQLDDGFELKFGKGESFPSTPTFYGLFIIEHNHKIIFIDSGNGDYFLDKEIYPLLYKIDNETFEILIKQSGRPGKDYLDNFRIEHDSIVSINMLPSFITKAVNLDGDDELEYAGSITFAESWTENDSVFTQYNPILYYEITKQGLQLDSTLTIKRNTKIYGKFSGYELDGKLKLPFSCFKKFEKEEEEITQLGRN